MLAACSKACSGRKKFARSKVPYVHVQSEAQVSMACASVFGPALWVGLRCCALGRVSVDARSISALLPSRLTWEHCCLCLEHLGASALATDMGRRWRFVHRPRQRHPLPMVGAREEGPRRDPSHVRQRRVGSRHELPRESSARVSSAEPAGAVASEKTRRQSRLTLTTLKPKRAAAERPARAASP